MKNMLSSLCLVSIMALCTACTSSKPHALLQGVWKVDEIVNLTTNETSPGENLHYMFTKKHLMTIGGKEDRPVVVNNFDQMSHEEILSQLPAGGGFMSYTIQDGKIYRTTLFALSEYFEGKTIITEFEVTENSLILRDDHYADGQLREWHMSRVE